MTSVSRSAAAGPTRTAYVRETTRTRVEHALQPGPAMLRSVLVAGVLVVVAACAEPPPEILAVAHESAPLPEGPRVRARSSYLGGTGDDRVLAVAGTLDLTVVAGSTGSPDFPGAAPGAVDTRTTAGCARCPADAFVTRLDPGTGAPAWTTTFGGPGFEEVRAATVDGDRVFVAGSAASLPAVTGRLDPSFAGGASAERGDEDGFVCELALASGTIRWCTFVGGSGPGGVDALAYDRAGDTLVVALTVGADEALDQDPTYAAGFTGRLRATPRGRDLVVLRLAGDGRSLVWATYVGGSGDEVGSPSLRLAGDRIEVAVETTSTDATVTVNDGAPVGGGDVYLAQLSADGRSQMLGRYHGGTGRDGEPRLGEPSLLVTTTSRDLPVWSGGAPGASPQPGCGDGDGWFVDPWSRQGAYLGGAAGDRLRGLAFVGGYGQQVVVGETRSSDLPVSSNASQPSRGGAACGADAFVATFAFGNRLDHATYLGGSGDDLAHAVIATALPGAGAVLVAGETASTDFPVAQAAQPSSGGGVDGFLTWYTWPSSPWPPGPGGGDGGWDGGGHDTDPWPGGDDTFRDGTCGCRTGADPGTALLLGAAGLLLRRRRRHR